jgi:hypothetical protein
MLSVAGSADELVRIKRGADVASFYMIVSVGGSIVPFVPSICEGTHLHQRGDGRADGGAVRLLIGPAVKVAHYHFTYFFPMDTVVDRWQNQHFSAAKAFRSGGTGLPRALPS